MSESPLHDTLIVDLTRMLPGAVLARTLLDLGARVIKVEQPGTGDPMRWSPPLVDGVSAGFRAFLAGAESITLDLRRDDDAARLRRLTRHADVLTESFRPGRLEGWGLGPETLRQEHPELVVCSLSAFGRTGGESPVAHDLNVTARTGLLSLLSTSGIPRTQFADVACGLMAGSAVLGALLARARSGRGCWIDQPLHASLLPFVAWPMTDAAFGGGGMNDGLLTGQAAAYRLYRCADGHQVALAALEPKFWTAFVELLGLSEPVAAGLDTGPAGQAVAARVEEQLGKQPASYWIERAAELDLPLTRVHDLASAADDALIAGRLHTTRRTSNVPAAGPFLPGLGSVDERPAPRLGQHGEALRDELGLDYD